MSYVADLHIHSRFSRATSKALTVPHLAAWGAVKGIDVLGCGDFTHPGWRQELARDLAYDEESGLYRLRGAPEELPLASGADWPAPLFCLQAEISCIYKRAGQVRKVHNLIFMPHLEAVENFCRRLEKVGNLASDGRPILGLDSRHLLEMALESSQDAVLVPAHIWTPWFALFGSRSGFDRIEDCFGDLTPHIFALETGLSSDPAMNRCLSALDGFALISNSDAHSGANLGREANLFAGRPSYAGLFGALRASAARPGEESGFLGTLEFYPEEGKYHLDGHRSCGISLDPRDAASLDDLCPHCGKPLTIGVLHRVMELADRREPVFRPGEPPARYLIPLDRAVGELLGLGEGAQKTRKALAQTLRALGPELKVLCSLPLEEISAHWEELGEAVARIRGGKIMLDPGYDGVYGSCRIFAPGELAPAGAGRLPGLTRPTPASSRERQRRLDRLQSGTTPTLIRSASFSPQQACALNAGPGPVLVLAGPGAGKTRVLIGRLQNLLAAGHDPRSLLAVTFTRRAAAEMAARLESGHAPLCDTLHGLALRLLGEKTGEAPLILGEDAAMRLFASALEPGEKSRAPWHWRRYSLCRETMTPLPEDLAPAAGRYAALKRQNATPLLDYGDLLDWLLAETPALGGRFAHVLVDEVQDLSPLQRAVLRGLLPADGSGFFGIGDPDQAIYAFRGAAGSCQTDLAAIWPKLELARLDESFRASQQVLDLACRVLPGDASRNLRAARQMGARLVRFQARDEQAEAAWIARQAAALLGSTSHSLLDQAGPGLCGDLGPGDIAVLVRLKAQMAPVTAALDRAGLPWSAPAAEPFWEDPVIARMLAQARSESSAPAPEELFARLAPALLPGSEAASIFCSGAAFGELCRLWRECGSWRDLLERVAWLDEAEMISGRAQKIQVMTMHAAKGLEFRAVFLPGLEAGLMPFEPGVIFGENGERERPGEDEERRLLFVAITRASEAVFVSHSQGRRLFGRNFRLPPSPFLRDMQDLCVPWQPRRKVSQLGLF